MLSKADGTSGGLRARLVSFITGVAMAFLFMPVYEYILGTRTPYLVLVDIAIYGLAGLIFGYLWPEAGWRLGVYLFAIWPPLLLFSLFLGGEALMEGPVDWRGMFRDHAGYLLMGVAACGGAWLGALIVRRFRNKPTTPN